MNTTKRFSVATLFALAALGTSALALAAPAAKPNCEGHEGKGHGGKDKGAHFQKADKNNDGFLTKDEVGDKRWSRIQVADANKDGKVSQPELQQARKDGKLGHGKPSQKA
jgi:EF hand